MDYEKKYKEALVNMQELYNSMKYMSSTDALHTTTALERAFPELKESEDEKIRKYLLKLADRCPEDSIDFMGEVKKEDVVAWLEKQGDIDRRIQEEIEKQTKQQWKTEKQGGQKSAWSEEDERLCNTSIRGCKYMVENFENSTQDYEDAIDWLNSLKGRVQSQWDADKKELKKIHNALEKCEIENIEHGKYYYCIKDYFCGGKKQASKGDVVQALRGLPIMALGVNANEYFLPVNSIKQNSTWSEEDEEELETIIDFLNNPSTAELCPTLRSNTIDWVNSLKERVQPKQGEHNTISPNTDSLIDSALNDYCCKVYNALHKENCGILSFARLQHLAMDIYRWCKENLQVEQKNNNKGE